MMEEFVLDARNFFFTSQDFLSFFFFFLNTKEKDFLVSRLNSPNVDIFFIFFSSSFALALHLDYAVSLRMVKKEHGVWLGLAHRRLTSSVYLITGQTGKRDRQSARRGCDPRRRAEND